MGIPQITQSVALHAIIFSLFTRFQIENMPSYKLTYFDGKGRAELCRLVFAAAGQEYEDKRISREEWPEFKAKTPLGQIPVLEVDGKMFGQSVAIASYLAKQFGLMGDNALDELTVNQVVMLIQDFIEAAVRVFREKDDARKAELQKEFSEVEIPKYLGILGKLLKENGSGYFVGDKLSLADLAVYAMTSDLEGRTPGCMDGFNDLKAHQEKVLSNDKLKTYIDNRKPTPF